MTPTSTEDFTAVASTVLFTGTDVNRVNIYNRNEMGFAKLFGSITESSLWSEPKEVRLLFVSMIARCNADGFIEAALPGLARLSNLTLDEVKNAIKVLESPDPHSKDLDENPENEGRRITKVPGGWMVLNYQAYRERRSDEDRREYMRNYMVEYRKTRKHGVNRTVNDVNKCKVGKPQLAQAEAEAEAEAEKWGSPLKPPNGSRLPETDTAKRVAGIFHRRPATEWTKKEIRAFRALKIDEGDLKTVEKYYADNWPPARDKNILRHDLLTFLNNFAGEVDRARNHAPEREKWH